MGAGVGWEYNLVHRRLRVPGYVRMYSVLWGACQNSPGRNRPLRPTTGPPLRPNLGNNSAQSLAITPTDSKTIASFEEDDVPKVSKGKLTHFSGAILLSRVSLFPSARPILCRIALLDPTSRDGPCSSRPNFNIGTRPLPVWMPLPFDLLRQLRWKEWIPMTSEGGLPRPVPSCLGHDRPPARPLRS